MTKTHSIIGLIFKNLEKEKQSPFFQLFEHGNKREVKCYLHVISTADLLSDLPVLRTISGRPSWSSSHMPLI